MAKLGDPFTLGVASGEPLADGVVIWTRLAPEPVHPDPKRLGGMPDQAVRVRWEVAEDERFTRVVRSGATQATRAWAHSVHVRVDGLRPAADYFYRFSVGSPFAATVSPVGRTRTAPDTASDAPVRFALASCQRYEHGFFTAYRHLAEERPDVVFHVGDYIYEYGKPANPAPGRYVRPLEPPAAVCTTLHHYRNRYARYRTDPDLRAAHAAAPWVTTWDDHEVRDDYTGRLPGDGSVPAAFLRRRTAAYRAYYEHLPLRVRPEGDALRMFRRRTYGLTADFMVLDVRQHRDRTTMLGVEQEEWLLSRLRNTPVRWKVLVQPLFFARRVFPGPPPTTSTDAWDAYSEQRSRILTAASGGTGDLVVLSGDVHNHWAGELKADFTDPSTPSIGVEFVGSAITSAPPATDGAAVLAANPHLKYFDRHRGYVTGMASSEEFRVEYRGVEFVDRKGAPVRTLADFAVEGGSLVRTDV